MSLSSIRSSKYSLICVQTTQLVSKSQLIDLGGWPIIFAWWEAEIAACDKNCIARAQFYVKSVLKFTSCSDPNIFTYHRSLGFIILDKMLAHEIWGCGRRGEPALTQMLLFVSAPLPGPPGIWPEDGFCWVSLHDWLPLVKVTSVWISPGLKGFDIPLAQNDS